MANKMYLNAIKEIMEGTISLNTANDLRVMLVTAGAYNELHDFVDDVVANEMAGSGYARKALTGEVVAVDAANDRAEFDIDDVLFAAINAGTATAAIIYKEAASDALRKLICWIDSGFPVVTNGGDVTLVVNAEGLIHGVVV